MTARYNASRNYTVNQRDGRGRVLSTTISSGLITLLSETLNWRNDGRLANYMAVRGDFTDVRNYGYSPYAQRLTKESFDVGASQSVTNVYAIDNGSTGGLGILTSQAQSGALSDTWSLPGGGLDGISRVIQSQNTVLNRPATGTAVGAATVTATLDSNPVNIQFDGPNSLDGTWRANLNLFPGSHTLAVSAVDPSGQYSATTNISFTCTGGATDTLTNTYDGNGNITQRIWINSLGVTNKVENLTWDAFNRLIQVTDRDTNNSGFNFTSIYDGFGRRVRTIETMVTNGVAITNAVAVSTVDSWYDPLVEFLEVGVNANGVFTTKTYGPDASGRYGGMQGVGGLETIYVSGHTSAHGSVEDYFGNVLATISNSVVTWTGARYSSYGPVPGYQPPTLNLNTSIELCLGWHGLRIDPSGDYRIGARTYSPVEGRFISADPMGHAASQDLYSFCGADPVNFYDPTGRYGKEYGDSDGYDTALANMPDQDIVAEMDRQEVVAGLLNLATLGIADPLAGVLTGYNLNGEMVDRGDAGENLLQASLMVLPLLIPGAGEADVMAEAGANLTMDAGGQAVMGAGENGLANLGGNTLADTTANALPQTAEQIEFPFAQQDLSGQLADVGAPAAPAEAPAQVVAETDTSIQGVSQYAEPIGPPSLSTASGQAYFWSGLGRGGETTAAQIAANNGGTTLEMLLDAQGITMPAWDASSESSVAAWQSASAAYARGASGDVNVILGDSLRPGNTWESVELPALQENENVSSITQIHPTTGQQSVIWQQ
jgi:RHS repeat-associated protein